MRRPAGGRLGKRAPRSYALLGARVDTVLLRMDQTLQLLTHTTVNTCTRGDMNMNIDMRGMNKDTES